MISIKALYVNWFSDKLISYVCLRLIRHLNSSDIIATSRGITSYSSIDSQRFAFITNNKGKIVRNIYQDTFPRRFRSLMARFLPAPLIKAITEWVFLRDLSSSDIAYLFPGCSLGIYKKIKKTGCFIVTERINTLRLNSKKILDEEYQRLNISGDHGISEESGSREITLLQLSDAIFSPSPAVTSSLREAGISSDKIIETSYGLDPEDLLDISEKVFDSSQVTILFAGRICVRKGVHLLLDIWKEANINGNLLLVGNISDDFKNIIDPFLDDPTVVHQSFVDDLKPLYRQADIFVLPSLEEGSPLVTYLALGASLPAIVSPMGAGGIIRDGQEGFIVDPHDQKQFIRVLRELASNVELRKKMAENAGKAARYYTWEQVAARRRKQLLKQFQQHGQGIGNAKRHHFPS